MRKINRRHFLEFGAALPLAISTLRRRVDEKNYQPPQRVIFICNSLGFYKRNFFPTKRNDLDSSGYLKHLSPREKLTVFENLYHPGMETSNHDSEKSFLTGAPGPEAAGFTNTISLDQVLARNIGTDTRFPHLSFSIYDRGWGCSWNGRGSAIPPMHDEEKIFNLLFGPDDLQDKERRIADDQHILDCLRRDLDHLTNSGKEAGQLGHYKSLIEELESQLEHENFWLNKAKPKVKMSLSQDRQFEFSTKIRNLFELATLAFRTDSTRVITISLDWIYGAINVPGATGGWHTLSHHGGSQESLKGLTCIETDIMKHFNRFLVDLDRIKEGNGSLLDHTTVVMGSNFGDASNHTCRNLPIIVAGSSYRHQQHQVLEKPTPLCNLWLELLQKHNIDVGDFGSSSTSDPCFLS